MGGVGGVGLLDGAGDDEQAEENKKRAEQADYLVRALTRNILCAHDDALTPDLKAHHDVRPDDIQSPEHEQHKPDDVLFHPQFYTCKRGAKCKHVYTFPSAAGESLAYTRFVVLSVAFKRGGNAAGRELRSHCCRGGGCAQQERCADGVECGEECGAVEFADDAGLEVFNGGVMDVVTHGSAGI